MADTTILGTNLSFSDVLATADGFSVVSRFGIKVPPAFSRTPNPSHLGISVLLPTCDQAAAESGKGYFDGLLLLSLAYQETLPKFNPRSSVASTPDKVARGMGQFLYTTGKREVKPPIVDFYNPAESIFAMAYYLRVCYDSAKKQAPTLPPSMLLGYACMHYNGGPATKLETHEAGKYNIVGGRKTRTTTKHYAQKINYWYSKFAGTPNGPMTFK